MWFYDLKADGYSLDDRRNPMLSEEKLGASPGRWERGTFVGTVLSVEDAVQNNLPDLVRRWAERAGSECKRSRTEQSFCVSKAEITASGYDLSLNRYREMIHSTDTHRLPKELIAELKVLEGEIVKGLNDLEGAL